MRIGHQSVKMGGKLFNVGEVVDSDERVWWKQLLNQAVFMREIWEEWKVVQTFASAQLAQKMSPILDKKLCVIQNVLAPSP